MTSMENLQLLMIALYVLAVLAAGIWWISPTQRLSRKLRPVWDGFGLTRVEVREVGEKRRTVRHRPHVSRRRQMDKKNGFSFIVRPNPGKTVEEIVECAPAVRDSLGAREVKAVPIGGGKVRLEVFKEEASPKRYDNTELEQRGNQADSGLPLGIDDSGELQRVSLGHTLIVGATGSGKGSMLWRYVMSVQERYGNGGKGLRLWGIDPKRAELAGVLGAFEDVAFDGQEILDVLEGLVHLMKSRQKQGRRSFEHDDENPLILLVIDEFNALSVMEDRKWQTSVRSALQQLLSQGRSAGIYVLAAAQQPQKEFVGPYRPHFMNRICLRVESSQEVDMVLGTGAVELGAEAHRIEPATESNGYKTAGIGFIRTDGEPAPVRVRAPFVSDEDIENWVARTKVRKGVGHGF